MKRNRVEIGFTLIELLVVVAIIGILVAIAIPNFLNAMVRAKVAEAQAEMTLLASTLECYFVDQNCYPPSCGVGRYYDPSWYANPVSLRLIPLTTPVAYVVSVPQGDPFPAKDLPDNTSPPTRDYDTYDYMDAANRRGWGSGTCSGGIWRLASSGPDRMQAWGGTTMEITTNAHQLGVDYDPTNGTTSAGDIVKVGAKAPTGNGKPPDDLSNTMRPGVLRVPFYREQWQQS